MGRPGSTGGRCLSIGRSTWRDKVYRLLPGLEQVRSYRSGWLRWDLLGGVTVAAYLVPQVMAYGVLAGLEPVAGLWASGRRVRTRPGQVRPAGPAAGVRAGRPDRSGPALPDPAHRRYGLSGLGTHAPLDQAATRAKPPAAQPVDDSGNARDGN